MGRVLDMLGGGGGKKGSGKVGGGKKAFGKPGGGFGFGLDSDDDNDDDDAENIRATGFDDDLSEIDDARAAAPPARTNPAGGCAGGLCNLPRAPDAIKFAGDGSGAHAIRPLGDKNDECNLSTGAPIKNVLPGSLVASKGRPHQLVIDADFVTCTQ